ncbi:hypothetical protein Ngar_c05370 [Candidatus Nitrososphaera gargensis Ga9.2]|uniref:Uncharacterized protein n=1 Tax=Nitrososphaera gargensis (strain Ga9.2) TaxID=1237085 RepID=K0ICU1_NITGG|nr:hypothetical protein [Candidatus Nitrososphaera gargensis]AFU57480.1 hypothetical protein Ngar_c05370 [Candidatus Nitrososphaera gargensis Ga9.2]
MSNSITVPVIAGLAVGVGFFILFSLSLAGTPKEPIMYLITADGNGHRAYNNVYCGEACDFLAYARVAPRNTPTIHIDKDSDFGLKTTNTPEQPIAVMFIVQSPENGSSSGSGTFSLPMRNGNYFAGSLESGEYILSVIAEWDNEQPNLIRSLHQFKVVII